VLLFIFSVQIYPLRCLQDKWKTIFKTSKRILKDISIMSWKMP